MWAAVGLSELGELPAAATPGRNCGMHVFITNPRLLLDLQFFLQRIGCAADQVDAHDLEVEVPGAPSAEQARRELELYLALWQGRKSISDAAVHICSSNGGGSPAIDFTD